MIIGAPFSSPFASPFASPFGSKLPAPIPPHMGIPGHLRPDMRPPEMDLKRAINYYADYSGCGFWRMIWPEHLLNAHNNLVMHGSTVMIFDKNFYRNTEAVRIQRQATDHQKFFVQHLKALSKEMGFRLIYEIDDLVFHEDIPEYNKFKPAFTDPSIRKNCQEIMDMCDEITVTCDFMKHYYMEKTGHTNITVIPNYPPKWWMGNFYDEKRISQNFDANQNKPRILYAGSGAHFDVENRVGQNDDFAHINKVIVDTIDKYQWVFLGAFPLPLMHFVKAKKIEYHPWSQLYAYPEKIFNLNVNMMVAPLQDNTFNKAKSDLKYIEACCYGLPIACQDIETYRNAPIRFKTADEMIDRIDETMAKKGKYMNMCAKNRKYAETRFLENPENIGKYVELYTLPYGSSDRTLLNTVNS